MLSKSGKYTGKRYKKLKDILYYMLVEDLMREEIPYIMRSLISQANRGDIVIYDLNDFKRDLERFGLHDNELIFLWGTFVQKILELRDGFEIDYDPFEYQIKIKKKVFNQQQIK